MAKIYEEMNIRYKSKIHSHGLIRQGKKHLGNARTLNKKHTLGHKFHLFSKIM